MTLPLLQKRVLHFYRRTKVCSHPNRIINATPAVKGLNYKGPLCTRGNENTWQTRQWRHGLRIQMVLIYRGRLHARYNSDPLRYIDVFAELRSFSVQRLQDPDGVVFRKQLPWIWAQYELLKYFILSWSAHSQVINYNYAIRPVKITPNESPTLSRDDHGFWHLLMYL